jgi:pimeloyl-ACP methyl ester carboxylesterase
MMGVPHVPSWLQARLRAIDAKFGAAAGVLYVGELRQVRRYLAEPDLKARVDGIVAEKVAGGTRILVGHSLGSVVAWEFVRQHPEHELDLLVTLGSPLGLRMVRSRLPEQGCAGRAPGHVGSWVNVRDLGDPVAFAGDLVTWWPGVDDRHVDNGRDDAHSASRYLSKAETGSAIAACHPGLGLQ